MTLQNAWFNLTPLELIIGTKSVLVPNFFVDLPYKQARSNPRERERERGASSNGDDVLRRGDKVHMGRCHTTSDSITRIRDHLYPSSSPSHDIGSEDWVFAFINSSSKSYFSSALPPGTDNVWFDYKGLPLKWYVPTGVLFDLLCAEPERPWNLTVHFRGSPGDVLTPCEGEESVKWSYINSLKEAAYVINGNCKNVMNMSQADQYDLWQSLLKGNMESYMKISSRFKLGPFGEDSLPSDESETVASSRQCRIPVRLYVRSIGKEIAEIEDAPIVDSWDKISYINRPFEMYKEEGGYASLKQAMKSLLPEIFDTSSSQDEGSSNDPKDPNAPDFEDESMKLILVGSRDRTRHGYSLFLGGQLFEKPRILSSHIPVYLKTT